MKSNSCITYVTILGFKPEKYRCEIPECDGGTNPEFKFYIEQFIPESSNQSIFVHEANGEINYCKTYPLLPSSRNNNELGKCTLSNFNLSSDPVECDAKISKVIYDEFPMDTTIVTDFNLFCNEEYKVHIYEKLNFILISIWNIKALNIIISNTDRIYLFSVDSTGWKHIYGRVIYRCNYIWKG